MLVKSGKSGKKNFLNFFLLSRAFEGCEMVNLGCLSGAWDLWFFNSTNRKPLNLMI